MVHGPIPILIDTREQTPWSFTRNEWPDGFEVIGLKTGDYTLKGFENVFTIDRKGSAGEVANNLVQDRFERELERMEEFAHPFIICDFPLRDLLAYPNIPSVPQYLRRKIKLKGPFLISVLERFWLQYKAKWIFAEKGDGAARAIGLMKRFMKLNVPQ
jgi:hypothetical protein